MVANNKMLLLLDDQGNLYQLSIYKLYTDNLDDYLVGTCQRRIFDTNVVNMQVGTDNDMIMVNQDGIYTLGDQIIWEAGPVLLLKSHCYLKNIIHYNLIKFKL